MCFYCCRMLSDIEKISLKEILKLMSEEDLKMLAQSLTENIFASLTIQGKSMSEDILKSMFMLTKTAYIQGVS